MSRILRTSPARCLAVCLSLALPGTLALSVASSPVAAQESARTEPLIVRSGSTQHRFSVEVMRTDAERSRGLMFRRQMAPDHGMLFDFATVAPISMWMKNTYLPLDMVFIRADGSISRIAADTEPLSTAIVPSGEPVLSVLELNAGTAARLGIRPGDQVEHPLFRTR